jgi:hypothetical protein
VAVKVVVECYVVMGCTVLAYSFRYSIIEYCVFTCGSFSFTAFYHFFECFIRLDLLVHLFYVHRSLAYKYLLGRLLQIDRVLV